MRTTLSPVAALIALSLAVGCSEADQGPSDTCTPGIECGPAPDAGGLPGYTPAPTPTPLVPGTSWPTPTPTPAPSATSDIPCEVQAVLSAHCNSCHSAGASAGSTLASRADFMRPSTRDATKTVAALARERIASSAPGVMMPPAGYPRLEAAQQTVLDAWLGAGLPARAEASCGGAVTPPATNPPVPEGATCFRMLAHNGDKKTKYKVGRANDVYINMSFSSPWGAETRYAVSMRPIVDNAAVIHHWLLFDEPGVDGAIIPGTGAHPGGQLLTGWAPGGDGIDLIGNPDDVGYEMRGNTNYLVEFHYNSSDPNAEDASGVEICMMDHKPKNIAALSWLGWDHLGPIPAERWWSNCKPLITTPIHIVGVTPHMHLDGARMRGIINRANGTKETLHDLAFDFNYQQSYKKDVVLNPGDTITTDCWFKKGQLFGHGTDNEMCYLFTYAYPKGALADFNPWGATAHGGSSCMAEGGTRGALDP